MFGPTRAFFSQPSHTGGRDAASASPEPGPEAKSDAVCVLGTGRCCYKSQAVGTCHPPDPVPGCGREITSQLLAVPGLLMLKRSARSESQQLVAQQSYISLGGSNSTCGLTLGVRATHDLD